MPNLPAERPESLSAKRGGWISVDQLIALNDEILALVRAGLPLERGLRAAGRDLGGRLGAVTEALAARMAKGESLHEALANEGDRIPEIYRAVVEAGARAGRLSVALEGLSAYARGYAETRRSIALALIYPLTVLIIAYGLLVGLAVFIAPKFWSIFTSLGIGDRVFLGMLRRAGDTVQIWGPILPVLLPISLLLWWISGRAASLDGGWAGRWLGVFPWMRSILWNSKAASYSEVLALLVDQRVPLNEAIPLAAAATGDRGLQKAANQLAEVISRGESPRDGARNLREFPALLRWLLATSEQQPSMVSALRHASDTYRRRALHQASLMRVLLPRILLVVVGAASALFYVLALMVPMATLMRNIANE
jgi:general secretion pathway protein F